VSRGALRLGDGRPGTERRFYRNCGAAEISHATGRVLIHAKVRIHCLLLGKRRRRVRGERQRSGVAVGLGGEVVLEFMCGRYSIRVRLHHVLDRGGPLSR